jgi:hypothetical protein
MMQTEQLRHKLKGLVNDLRTTLQEIGQDSLPQAQVVSNTRDRLHYIASLTEQAASQTLNAAESIGDRLRQQQQAQALAKLTRSAQVRAFLKNLEKRERRFRPGTQRDHPGPRLPGPGGAGDQQAAGHGGGDGSGPGAPAHRDRRRSGPDGRAAGAQSGTDLPG